LIETFHSSLFEALTGSKDDKGLGRRCFCTLYFVKAMNPLKETKNPSNPRYVIGMPKKRDVTTMAKIRRMQFNAAWCTTEILDKMYVDAKLYMF
jgi:hypothetical protein